MGHYLVAFLLAAVALAQTQQDYPSQIARKPALDPREFVFTYTNGASPARVSVDLSAAGAKTATLTPCPKGVAGANVSHSLRISGGTGTAEAVLITGGTCTSGAATGTITFTTVNTHTGSWSLTSATGGVHESVCMLPSAGGTVVIPSDITLYANAGACGKTGVQIEKLPGATVSGSFTILGGLADKPGSHQAFNQGPTWTTLTDVYNGLRVDVGGYPITSQFGNNAVALVQGLVGTVEVPASAAFGNASFGVAGYGRTTSTSVGAVGGLFYGGIGASGASAWGLNAIVNNCGQPQCADNTGFDGGANYGLELNFNLVRKSGGVTPNMPLRGIYGIGDSKVAPSNFTHFIDVDSYGINQVPKLKWDAGFYTVDGSATNALDIGTTATGNTVGSQVIQLRSRSAAGTNKTTTFQADPDGNMILRPGASGGVAIQDGAGTTQLFSLPGLVSLRVDAQIDNDKKIFWKDSGGTARPMLWMDGSNDFHVGAQIAPVSAGDLFLYARGTALLSLEGVGSPSLYPVVDNAVFLGDSTHRFATYRGTEIALDSVGIVDAGISINAKDGGFNYVTLRGPTVGSTTYTISFPAPAPAANQTLQSDASGNLSWVSGSGLPVVDTTSIVKGSVTDTKQFRLEADTNIPVATITVGTLPATSFLFAGQDITNTFTVDQWLNNDKKILWKDSGGTARSMLWLDGSNNFNIGAQAAPISNGDMILWTRGTAYLKLDGSTSPVNFTPNADRQVTLGQSALRYLDAHIIGEVTIYSRASAPTIDATLNLQSRNTAAFVSLMAHTGMAGGSDYTLTFPQVGPAASQMMQSDASGNLSWINTPTGTVTTVTGTSPIVSSGGTTPAISCSTCIIETGTQTMSGTKTFTGGIIMNGASILVTAGTSVILGAAAATQRVTNAHFDNWNLYVSGAVTNGATLDVSSGGTVDFNSGSTLTAPNGSNGVTATLTSCATVSLTISGGIITAASCT